MTTSRDPDRVVRAWLDLMPSEAPDRAIDAVLQTVETTPQVRSPWRWLPWRPTPMNRIPLAIAAAAVVVIAGAALILRSTSNELSANGSRSARPSGGLST